MGFVQVVNVTKETAIRSRYACENPREGAPANNKIIFGVAILVSIIDKNVDSFWQIKTRSPSIERNHERNVDNSLLTQIP